jgi:TolB-like protein
VLFPAAAIWNWRHGEAGAQKFATAEIGAYVIFGIAAIACSSWYWQSTPASTRPVQTAYEPARTLAVLPFENAGSDAEVQFLCDGIAESLINWLATVPDVKVISKSAAFRLREFADDTAKIADALGVDGIIRGRLERVGDQIVVSTSFVDTRDESQLWGERLVQPASEVIYLERSIVDSIKAGLRLEVSDELVRVTAAGGTDDPAAYEHYMRGHYLIQSTNSEAIYEGLDELREAIRLDPQYARPHADIADALSQLVSYGSSADELVIEARGAAYTAVALAPNLPEAQTAFATMLQFVEFDWEKVDEAYEAAVALAPQSPVLYHRYTDYLVITLRPERATEMAARAIAQDALDSSSMHAVGLAAMINGDFEEAVRAFGEWNNYHPGSRWSYIKHALALALNGQCDESLMQASIIEEMLNHEPSALMDSWIAWGHKVCARETEYQRSVDRIKARWRADPERLDPGIAYMLALEGDADGLVTFFTRVAEARSPFTAFMSLFVYDHLGFAVSDVMPTHARYRALRERLKFPVLDLPPGDSP